MSRRLRSAEAHAVAEANSIPVAAEDIVMASNDGMLRAAVVARSVCADRCSTTNGIWRYGAECASRSILCVQLLMLVGVQPSHGASMCLLIDGMGLRSIIGSASAATTARLRQLALSTTMAC